LPGNVDADTTICDDPANSTVALLLFSSSM
jgi:hypothetical protein